jgi:NADPH-dependent curcumin reductase
MTETNRRWLLAKRPHGPVKDDDFRMVTEAIPTPGDGEFVVRVTHLSFDPTQRGWLVDAPSYLPPVQIGEVMRAGAVGQVVASNHPGYPVGERVNGTFGWQDYALSDGSGSRTATIVRTGVSAEQALGVFGVTGLTAYFGLMDLGQPKAGETVLVSGAAGATGSVVVQIAKNLGCKVIGIAGGPDKCAWVRDVARADACIDYKNQDVRAELRALAPRGVNIFFENVGGEILEAGLDNIAQNARVVLCGGISSYNAVGELPPGPRNYMQLVIKRARMEGFIILDYAPRFGEAVQKLAGWIAEGKMNTAVDMQEGLENAPATLRRLFEGKNLGKQLLRL